MNPFRDFTVDHVIPVSRGGSDHIDNMVPACKPCNSRKSAQLIVGEEPTENQFLDVLAALDSLEEFIPVTVAARVLGIRIGLMNQLIDQHDITLYQFAKDKRYKLIRRSDVEALMKLRPIDRRRKETED